MLKNDQGGELDVEYEWMAYITRNMIFCSKIIGQKSHGAW